MSLQGSFKWSMHRAKERESKVGPTIWQRNSVAVGKMALNFLPFYFRKSSIHPKPHRFSLCFGNCDQVFKFHHHDENARGRRHGWGHAVDFTQSHHWSKDMIELTSKIMFCLISLDKSYPSVKHLSPDPAVFPWCNAEKGGAKLIIAKHLACHANKHSPDSWKENVISLLTGLAKAYCCMLLSQIRPEGKILLSQIAFCAHTTRIAK